jgi:hypothetical protein
MFEVMNVQFKLIVGHDEVVLREGPLDHRPTPPLENLKFRFELAIR